jgi:hypothetical protein
MATRLRVDEALRVRLEGRVELIERAASAYTPLLWKLSGPGWKRRLQRRPQLLEEVWALEPELPRVLEDLEQLARRKHWPGGHPLRAAVRTLQAQRQRLMELAPTRLSTLSSVREEPFPAVLLELEAHVLASEAPRAPDAPPMWLPGLLEPLTTERLSYRFLLVLFFGWLCLGVMAEDLPSHDRLNELIVLGGLGLCLISSLMASLTMALIRYVWRHFGAKPEGEVGPVVISKEALSPGSLGAQGPALPGVLVLRPAFAAFIPSTPEPREALVQMLERLRRLSWPEDFDTVIQQLVRQRAGTLWKSDEVGEGPAAASSPTGFQLPEEQRERFVHVLRAWQDEAP